MTILCQVCGTANPDTTTYCEGCGVELSATSSPAPTVTPEVVLQESAAQGTSGGSTASNSSPLADAAPDAAVALPNAEGAAANNPADPALLETATVDAAAEMFSARLTELPASEVLTSEGAVPAVAPPAEVLPAAPALTGEAKLGIKKFGAPTGEFIPLQGERLVVGRFDASSGPVDIDLSSLGGQEHISRRHAELHSEQGVWSVRDLGSTNGVYVKRKGETNFSPRLQEPATLSDGDELAFGNLMLTFHQS